jgi:pyridoxal 5'-phosphate synthase pdxS subunit
MNNTQQYELNKGLAQMLKGGVIMDVTTPEQAKIAQEAGACAVWLWSAYLLISVLPAVYLE